jgi:hypothetical protein
MISVDARERLASLFAKMTFMLTLKMSPWIEVDTSEVRCCVSPLFVWGGSRRVRGGGGVRGRDGEGGTFSTSGI